MHLISNPKLALAVFLFAFFIFTGCRGNNNQTGENIESPTSEDTAYLNEKFNNELKTTSVKLEFNTYKVESLSSKLKDGDGRSDLPKDFWTKKYMFTTGFSGGFIAEYHKDNKTLEDVHNELRKKSVICLSYEAFMTNPQYSHATEEGAYLKLNYLKDDNNQIRYLIYTDGNPFSGWAFWQTVPDFYSHQVTIKEFNIDIKTKDKEQRLSNKLQCFMSSGIKSSFTWGGVQEALRHVAKMSKLQPEE